MHWFLKSLPHGTLNGLIRVTEQGETIERKYANKVNAAYNLELMVAGVVGQSIQNRSGKRNNDTIREEIFSFLSRESYHKFKEFTGHPHFMRFYQQATPIDAIESSKIGSRPARRSGKKSISDLRAIPWVFSWTQSRMHISSWFGVGTTLDKLKKEDPEKYEQLKSLAKTDNFVRYVLTNIDTSLAATDEKIIELYSSLVEENDVRNEISAIVLKELSLSREMMNDLLTRPIKERRKNHYYSTQLRALALLPLHHEQVNLLKQWRKARKDENKEDSEKLLHNLLRSINAIANAMGTTG